jgi:ElaA protein
MDYSFQLKIFDDLSLRELYEILRLRSEVFVVEQACPYLDTDRKDYVSWHLSLYVGSELAAYARLLPVGVSYPIEASIGRVVSSPAYRKTGVGRKLMQEAISQCAILFPTAAIRIGAQAYLIRFYESMGFEQTGNDYMEDGIPHTEMLLVR